MAKRPRADIKAALAAASGAEQPLPDPLVQKEVAFDSSGVEKDAKEGEILERGGERPKKPKKALSGHKRTSTGYVKSDGQEVVRLTLHMSAEQKKAFKIQMVMGGFDNPSAFVINTLNLDE